MTEANSPQPPSLPPEAVRAATEAILRENGWTEEEIQRISSGIAPCVGDDFYWQSESRRAIAALTAAGVADFRARIRTGIDSLRAEIHEELSHCKTANDLSLVLVRVREKLDRLERELLVDSAERGA